MAASFTWPATLPQFVQRGYTESVGLSVLRTSMDAGPAKMRLRGKRPNTLKVSFLMSTAQVSILESFIYDTIQGISRFNFIHPRTEAQVEVRIVPMGENEFFSISYSAPGYYIVNMTLEVVP